MFSYSISEVNNKGTDFYRFTLEFPRSAGYEDYKKITEYLNEEIRNFQGEPLFFNKVYEGQPVTDKTWGKLGGIYYFTDNTVITHLILVMERYKYESE